MRTHSLEQCDGRDYGCCIHNPSDHPLNTAPMHHRVRGGILFTERICPHGIGHPDPDSMTFLEQNMSRFNRDVEEIHGCDGCCGAWNPEVDDAS